MDDKKSLSQPTKDLVSFLNSLPGVRNLRVYTSEERTSLEPTTETTAVRRVLIREKNRPAGEK
ncbi:TPA: hypothetical protein ACPHXL_003500 [Vibrio alginolyticus]|jgi:hypothetical protein|uniref:hypothetical protein n=1 Tax=Vibrio alginolyticus TaxID=663 RepID=UPI0022774186|nr:hypothetical protein [Vibrio alginolyticus]WAE59658.1 hypothetical protein OPR71_24415 [Vibrio alginolyticus]